MYAEFDDSLITGNKMIDAQHRELIEKINNLLKSCEDRSNKVGAIKMLDYLADYTDFHFSEEEKLQEEIGYPGLKEHKEKHQELRQVVEELTEMLQEEEGPTEAFVHQVQVNIKDWLFGHIKTFDRSVAEYAQLHHHADLL